MPEQPSEQLAEAPDFDRQYRPLAKAVFLDLARQELAQGMDAAEQARAFAERGKPEFVLAYLLLCDHLPDDEKRALFAQAHEQRADYIERRAREFDREFHRPFPLLFTEAARDRLIARQIRAGRAIQRGAGRQLPQL